MIQIGDDEVIWTLQEYTAKETLPPNLRHWFQYILKELEKNWRKITQKWPDPWIDLKGAIETGSGRLIMEQDREINVSYSIYRQLTATPREMADWGGVMTAASFFHFINLAEAYIELTDGRRGKIILSGFSGNTAYFTGTGPYPD